MIPIFFKCTRCSKKPKSIISEKTNIWKILWLVFLFFVRSSVYNGKTNNIFYINIIYILLIHLYEADGANHMPVIPELAKYICTTFSWEVSNMLFRILYSVHQSTRHHFGIFEPIEEVVSGISLNASCCLYVHLTEAVVLNWPCVSVESIWR